MQVSVGSVNIISRQSQSYIILKKSIDVMLFVSFIHSLFYHIHYMSQVDIVEMTPTADIVQSPPTQNGSQTPDTAQIEDILQMATQMVHIQPLKRALGGNIYLELTEWNGSKRVDLRFWKDATVPTKVNSLYVSCPLVEPRMVGDAQVPLLRIVPVAGRDGEMMTRAFDHIQYCPLVLRRFQTVEIDIRDDTGVKIPFERGRVVVTLHCRKRKESYLE